MYSAVSVTNETRENTRLKKSKTLRSMERFWISPKLSKKQRPKVIRELFFLTYISFPFLGINACVLCYLRWNSRQSDKLLIQRLGRADA